MENWNKSLFFLVLFALAATNGNASECPEEFSRNGEFCYRYFNEEKTWPDAESHCNQFTTSDGTIGQLASVHSAAENDFISTLSAVGSGQASDGVGPFTWIGLQTSGGLSWSDGTPVDYQWFAPGEPNRSGECGNTNQYGKRDEWDDQPCSTLEPFVCKIPLNIEPFDTTFWTSYTGSLYRFYCDKATWDEAKTKCESDSAHLVIINDSDENDFVSTLTASSTKKAGQPTWIGLKEKTPVSFAWSDGTNYEGDYDKLCCVHTNDGKSRGNWNNGDCSSKLAFVCERDE